MTIIQEKKMVCLDLSQEWAFFAW